MPRGSLHPKDAMQSFGFKEGIVLVDKSVVTVFQFPANKETQVQSDPFTCVLWHCTKLDKDLNVIPLAEHEQPLRIPFRLGKPENIRPGFLKEKDWDDEDVLPKDLGSEVDTEGNSVHIEEGQNAEGNGWAKTAQSLIKIGFKESVLGKGVAPLYDGMIVALKTTVDGQYVAKKGKDAGKTKDSTYLEATRVYRFPYDKQSKVQVGGAEAPASKASKNVNGKAEEAGDGPNPLVKTIAGVIENARAKFKTEMFTGKPVDRKKFQNALVKELMATDLEESVHDDIMKFVKDDSGLKMLSKEVGFKVGEDSVTFAEE